MKNKIFKTFLAIAPALCLVFALGACGGHEHTYSQNWTSDEEYHWHAADCGHDAVSDKAAHDFNGDGICTVCNYDSGHEHSYSQDWSYNTQTHWHAADCGHELKQDEAPHVFDGEDGDCSVCGYNILRFEAVGTTSYRVIGHYDNTVSEITIPELYHGKPVTGIGSGAFENFANLEHITIPKSVTSIEGDAFLHTAYYDNPANWENGVLYIEDCLISGGADGAYTVKGGTRLIAAYAFANCNTLTQITLADSVEHIGRYAFGFCRNLATVNAGTGLKSIANYAFYYCDKLSSFNFEGDFEQVTKGEFWNAYTAL